MKKVKVVYTDNSEGLFCCESIKYDRRAIFIITTDGEHIVIPYHNAYIIREQED